MSEIAASVSEGSDPIIAKSSVGVGLPMLDSGNPSISATLPDPSSQSAFNNLPQPEHDEKSHSHSSSGSVDPHAGGTVQFLTSGPIVGLEEKHEEGGYYEFVAALKQQGEEEAADEADGGDDGESEDDGELDAELGLWNPERGQAAALDAKLLSSAPAPVIAALEEAAKASVAQSTPHARPAASISQSGGKFNYAVDDDLRAPSGSFSQPFALKVEPERKTLDQSMDMKANPLFDPDDFDDLPDEEPLQPNPLLLAAPLAAANQANKHGGRQPSISYSFAYGDGPDNAVPEDRKTLATPVAILEEPEVEGQPHEEKKAEEPLESPSIVISPPMIEIEGEGEIEGAPAPMPAQPAAAVISLDSPRSSPSLGPAEVKSNSPSLQPLSASGMGRRQSAVGSSRSRSHLPDAKAVDDEPIEFKSPGGPGPLSLSPNSAAAASRSPQRQSMSIFEIPPPPDEPPPSFDEAMASPAVPISPASEADWLAAQRMQMETMDQQENMNPLARMNGNDYYERKSPMVEMAGGPLIYGGDGKLVGAAPPDADYRSLSRGGYEERDPRDRLSPRAQVEGSRLRGRPDIDNADAMYARFERRLHEVQNAQEDQQKETHRAYLTYVLGICYLIFCIWPILRNNWTFESQNINPMIGPSISVLVDLGAKNVYRMLNGEYWRLISSCILNAGIVQLVMNLITLMQNGSALEYTYGTPRVLFIFICSGLMGQFFSCAMNPTMIAVGSTGAVTGFSGAALGELFHFPAKLQENKFCYVLKILINFMVSIAIGFIPLVDNWAIFGGFIGGVFSSCVALYSKPKRVGPEHEDEDEEELDETPAQSQRRVLICIGSLLALVALFVGLGWRLFSSNVIQNWCSTCEKFGCWRSQYWNCDTFESFCGTPDTYC